MEYTAGNQATLPATGHDMYNYLARYKKASFQIQTILTIDGRLDFDRLSSAVRLSVDAEPVFGCRFIEADPPYWIRLDNMDKALFCSIEETEDLSEAVIRFLESPLNMDQDPMVKVKLIRSSQNDSLCIKVNHACCDAAGLKEYLQLLSYIYSYIGNENGVYIPQPGIRSRNDQDRLFSELGITDPETAWIPFSDISIPTWGFPWKHDVQRNMRVALCKLPDGQLEVMTGYAKANGATINDLILTALYRAMLKMGTPLYGIPMEIPITVDLRRYLPDHKTEAIRNFSGSVNTFLIMKQDESFSGTSSRVMSAMKKIKDKYPGLQSAIGLERIEKWRLKEVCARNQVLSQFNDITSKYVTSYFNLCSPVLSNLGLISKSLIKFGKNIVTEAYMVPPVVRVPGLLLMAGSYNDILTFSVCYYESVVGGKDMERLLDNIKNELTEGCRL